MEWPHAPDGAQASERQRKYGHAVLVKKLDEDEGVPVTAGEYAERFGDHPVRLDHERVVSVADILEQIDNETVFQGFPAFHRAVGEAMREADDWPYGA